VLLCLLSGRDAFGCSRAYTPDVYEDTDFVGVFLGEVSGVRLTAYEDFRLAQLQPRQVNGSDDELTGFYPISATPQFEANTIVLERFVGTGKSVETLLLGGCLVPIPPLKARGLFFITLDGSVVPVFQSSSSFDRWLTYAKNLAGKS
jgi:hypothetical protein